MEEIGRKEFIEALARRLELAVMSILGVLSEEAIIECFDAEGIVITHDLIEWARNRLPRELGYVTKFINFWDMAKRLVRDVERRRMDIEEMPDYEGLSTVREIVFDVFDDYILRAFKKHLNPPVSKEERSTVMECIERLTYLSDLAYTEYLSIANLLIRGLDIRPGVKGQRSSVFYFLEHEWEIATTIRETLSEKKEIVAGKISINLPIFYEEIKSVIRGMRMETAEKVASASVPLAKYLTDLV